MAQIMDIAYNLPTDKLSGSIPISANFIPKYVAILNYTDASLSLKDGVYLDKPLDVIPMEPKTFLTFDVRPANQYTLFWESEGFLSTDESTVTVRFSDSPLILQGGTLRTAQFVQGVEIVGIPNVNVGGTVDTNITGTPTVHVASIATGDNNIGNVDVLSLPDIPQKPLVDSTANIGKVEVTEMPTNPQLPATLSAGYLATRIMNQVTTKESPSQTFGAGTGTRSGGAATAMGPNQSCSQVTVQASSANTSNILVGSTAANAVFELVPGAAVTINIINVQLVFVGGTGSYNYLWRD